MTMRRFFVLPLLATLLPLLVLAVPLLAQGEDPTANYRLGTPLLKKPVQMPQAVSMLCRGLTPQEQARFNETQQGVHANKYAQVYVSPLGKITLEQQRRMIAAYEKARYAGPYSPKREARLAKQYFEKPVHYPVGTVLTKEKFGNPQGKGVPELLTVMVKREKGYNPACFDWEFLVVEGSGKKVLERGKLERCQGCHTKYTRTDGVATLAEQGFFGFR